MSEKIELYKQHSQKQENYTYYLTAVSVAALGFVVHQTHEKGFVWSMVPLCIAVLCWGLSVMLGLRYLNTVISLTYKNMEQMKMKDGHHHLTGNQPVLIQEGIRLLNEQMHNDKEVAVLLYVWQGRLFYGGMLLYFCWHLYSMYLLT